MKKSTKKLVMWGAIGAGVLWYLGKKKAAAAALPVVTPAAAADAAAEVATGDYFAF